MKHMKKIIRNSTKLAISLFAGVLLLTACGSGSAGGSNKVLNIATRVPSNSLNNIGTSEQINHDIFANYLEGLVVKGLDGDVKPGVAEKWDVSADETEYTFHLRKTNWEDGTPVTAHDFVFGWQQVANYPEAAYKNYLEYLKNGKEVRAGDKPATELGVEAIDDYTLKVTLDQPRTYILPILVHATFMPINEAFYTSVGADSFGTSKDTVLANGPYVLSEYDGATGYTLQKRDKYWDAKNVQMETVNVRVVTQNDTQAVLFENGEIDELYLRTGELIDKYADSPLLAKEKEQAMFFMYISPNTGTPAPVFANANFRSAIAYAIDKTIITDNVLRDGSIPADYLIPYGITRDGKEFRDYAGNFNKPQFDTAKAQDFFAKAKTELGDIPTEMTITISDTESGKRVYENIKSQLETNLPGLKVTLDILPTSIFFPTLYEYRTPSGTHGWSSNVNDPVTFLDLFVSTASFNFGKVNIPEYDKYVAASNSTEAMLNPDKRWEDVKLAEEEVMNAHYNIPIYQRGNKKLVREGISGLSYETGAQNTQYKLVTRK